MYMNTDAFVRFDGKSKKAARKAAFTVGYRLN